jgi:hypothetical protein
MKCQTGNTIKYQEIRENTLPKNMKYKEILENCGKYQKIP